MKARIHHIAPALLSLASLFSIIMCGKKEDAQTSRDAGEPMAKATAVSDRGTASAVLENAEVSINYGRPQLQGRDMLAQATEGMVWRMGMNEATEIKTARDLKFGETMIPQGSYSLWLKKMNAEEWALIINKKTGIWGTEYSAADDVATVPLIASTTPETVETFTIELTAVSKNAGALKVTWGKTALSTEFMVSAGTR